MPWEIQISTKVQKAIGVLPDRAKKAAYHLLLRIRESGPVQPSMPHFGKLKGQGETYHCHLNKGRPTYVAVWRVSGKRATLIEVKYVGTHEKAPY